MKTSCGGGVVDGGEGAEGEFVVVLEGQAEEEHVGTLLNWSLNITNWETHYRSER